MISNPLIISTSIHLLVVLVALAGLPSFKSFEYDVPLSMNVEILDINEIENKEEEIETIPTKKYSSSSNQKPSVKQENLIISKSDKLDTEQDIIEDIPIKNDKIEISIPKKKPKISKAKEEILTNLEDNKDKKNKVDKVTALLDKFPDDREVKESIILENKIEVPVKNVNMTQAEKLRIKQQLGQCWNPPIGVREANNLKVKIKISLNKDGSLIEVISLSRSNDLNSLRSIAVNSALRAVKKCAPYDFPTEKYEQWKEIVTTFDPKNM